MPSMRPKAADGSTSSDRPETPLVSSRSRERLSVQVGPGPVPDPDIDLMRAEAEAAKAVWEAAAARAAAQSAQVAKENRAISLKERSLSAQVTAARSKKRVRYEWFGPALPQPATTIQRLPRVVAGDNNGSANVNPWVAQLVALPPAPVNHPPLAPNTNPPSPPLPPGTSPNLADLPAELLLPAGAEFHPTPLGGDLPSDVELLPESVICGTGHPDRAATCLRVIADFYHSLRPRKRPRKGAPVLSPDTLCESMKRSNKAVLMAGGVVSDRVLNNLNYIMQNGAVRQLQAPHAVRATNAHRNNEQAPTTQLKEDNPTDESRKRPRLETSLLEELWEKEWQKVRTTSTGPGGQDAIDPATALFASCSMPVSSPSLDD